MNFNITLFPLFIIFIFFILNANANIELNKKFTLVRKTAPTPTPTPIPTRPSEAPNNFGPTPAIPPSSQGPSAYLPPSSGPNLGSGPQAPSTPPQQKATCPFKEISDRLPSAVNQLFSSYKSGNVSSFMRNLAFNIRIGSRYNYSIIRRAFNIDFQNIQSIEFYNIKVVRFKASHDLTSVSAIVRWGRNCTFIDGKKWKINKQKTTLNFIYDPKSKIFKLVGIEGPRPFPITNF